MRLKGAIVPSPRENAYDPTDVATTGELRRQRLAMPESGDVAACEQLTAPLLKALRKQPMRMVEIKAWATRQRPAMSVKISEECVYWLEMRRVIRAIPVGASRMWVAV